MTKSVLVTGANRGIGLSFCQHYKSKGYDVYAVCRHASSSLENLEVNVISGVDIANPESVALLADRMKGVHIDILVNNAGVLRDERLGQLDFQSIQQQFEVNTLGPLRVTEAVLDSLSEGSKIAIVTSRMGSIEDNTSGGRYGYRMSKCALNIASVSLAHDLKARGISVAILHPGLVGTDMIGGVGDITPDEAAERLIQRIEGLNLNNTGTFWHSNGEVLPW